jgi:hypothetical protein
MGRFREKARRGIDSVFRRDRSTSKTSGPTPPGQNTTPESLRSATTGIATTAILTPPSAVSEVPRHVDNVKKYVKASATLLEFMANKQI